MKLHQRSEYDIKAENIAASLRLRVEAQEMTPGACPKWDREKKMLQAFFTEAEREALSEISFEVMGQEGAMRLVLPPAVSNVIARQRDALTSRVRSRAATATAEDRKARGLKPGFQKAK